MAERNLTSTAPAAGGLQKQQSSLALLYSLPQGPPIWGLASLGDELLVVRDGVSHVDVYRFKSVHRRINVPGLTTARDLAACCRKACLYISDVGGRKAEAQPGYSIHRVSVDGSSISRWSIKDKPWGVSVTALNSTVLATFVQLSLVVEYSTYGQVLRHVNLPGDVLHPLHADWLPNGQLVVSHGDGSDHLHRLCAFDVDEDGQATLVRAVGDQRPTTAVLDVAELEHSAGEPLAMDVPGHLAVDCDNDLVLVADSNNSRLLIVSERLRRCDVLLELDAGQEFPVRLSLDVARSRLYVAYNGAVRNGRWTAGCVLVFFFSAHQCSLC